MIVGKITTACRFHLKPKAQLQTQRPTKVPIHNRNKPFKLLHELEHNNIIRQIGSNPSGKSIYGTTFLTPLFNTPKGDTIK